MSTGICVSLTRQELILADPGGERVYRVSTSRYGPGEERGSFRTPRGRHVIRAKIGRDMPAGTVFVGRRPTGELLTPELYAAAPDRDWILTRILWLSGTEPGRNRLGNVDTMRRYVYIHGCPDQQPVGVPHSLGCIEMRNSDIVELFDRVDVGTPVSIGE